jgi:hypothetical protein
VTSCLRTPAEVLQVFTTHSTINHDGTYVVLESIDIDGLSLKPSKSGLLLAAQRKFELLHFGYVAQWEAFRGAGISKQLFSHDDTSLPRLLWFSPRFIGFDSRCVWMLIKGYINKLYGEIPIDLRMGVPAPTTNFDGLREKLFETRCKVSINSTYQIVQGARAFED